jgi:hypothetical protein
VEDGQLFVLERLLALLAPEAYAVAHDALAGPPPLRDEVVAPAGQSQRLHGDALAPFSAPEAR